MRTPNTIAATRSTILSVTFHAIALIALLGVLHTTRQIAPFKLPGTNQGTKLLTYYAPGSPPHAISDIPTKTIVKETPTPVSRTEIAAPKPKPIEAGAPSAERGTGNSLESGLGEGDIKIALQTFNPYPKPNISSLAHGTTGDVVLDAVIDEHGKITGLTLLKGLGPQIDDTIIATVKQWTYSPATKNGIPVPSEQELHFHYERS